MITVDINIDIDADGAVKKLSDQELWTFAARQWHGLYAPFVPVDTGRLQSDVTIAPGSVTHNAPYAAIVYYSGGGGALGSGRWDRAAAHRKTELISAVQAYIDGGGLRLGG